MSDHRATPRKADPFLRNYDDSEIRIAAEFLSNWLPFLSRGLCDSCSHTLSDGIRSLHTDGNFAVSTPNIIDLKHCKEDHGNCTRFSSGNGKDIANHNDNADTHLSGWDDDCNGWSEVSSKSVTFSSSTPLASSTLKKSWADMALEDELAEFEENEVTSRFLNSSAEGTSVDEAKPKVELSREQREYIRFNSVQREKDFICLERVHGKIVNILDGLELHKGIFSAAEQKRIVSYVEELQEMGRAGKLKERTYSAPLKWMRGKGRVTLQFGCCYNYATDKNGNPPGILRFGEVDPLPHLLKVMIKRLVRWHVLPPSCVPDSCIVNIYDEGDCIPPHIDNHDFVRPFCTVSFLSECEILFGSNLKIVGPGEFSGSYAIPLPVGSVLVLNGNGADVAKHCVPAVPSKRISITFRKMDVSKQPSGHVPEPDLQGLEPLPDEVDRSKKYNWTCHMHPRPRHTLRKPVAFGRDDRTDKQQRGLLGEKPDARYSGGRSRQFSINNNRRRLQTTSESS